MEIVVVVRLGFAYLFFFFFFLFSDVNQISAVPGGGVRFEWAEERLGSHFGKRLCLGMTAACGSYH